MRLAFLTLSQPDKSNTLPQAAACNLLQHLAHFLRNPLQEPAVQEEKEKKQLLKTFGKTKRGIQFKVSVPNVPKITL